MYRFFAAVALMMTVQWAAAQGTVPASTSTLRPVISAALSPPTMVRIIKAPAVPVAEQSSLNDQVIETNVIRAAPTTMAFVAIVLMLGIALRRYRATRQ